jgi:ABC-2 type transport system permease protein
MNNALNWVSVFLGALHYEFVMQIRRKTLWLTMFICALIMSLSFHDLLSFSLATPLTQVIGHWLMLLNAFLPLVAAFFIADRFLRDQQTKVVELLTTSPVGQSSRLFGKYIGNMGAVLLPIFLFYMLGVGLIVFHVQDIHTIGLALVMFMALVVPAILFVSALSLFCTAFIAVPLYQVLFVGYWFWGNIFPPYPHTPLLIPTLSGTILTPIGSFISAGFFHVPAFAVNSATITEGVESLLLLLGISFCAIGLLCVYVRWQQASL